MSSKKPKKQKPKKKKNNALIICHDRNQYWTTQKQFWQWVREGLVKKTGDGPLTGYFVRRDEEKTVVIANTVLNLGCPNHLREETIKGIYGRLKQGLYPFRAVIGYLDAGKGQPKKIDPVQSPLVRQAFELYAAGNWGLIALADEMYERGLRNKRGNKVTVNGLSTMLHNPFYFGLIRIGKTGEMFAGKHQPIISQGLFDEAQTVFEGKNIKKTERHFFIFRRQVFCAKCRNLYIAETQKGNVYYRCHTRNCTRGTLREELLEKEVIETTKKLQMDKSEYEYFKRETFKESQKSEADYEAEFRRLQLFEDHVRDRLSKLADAYVDGVFDKETYINKKNELLMEEQSIKEKLVNFRRHSDEAVKRMEAFLELVNSAYLSYKWGAPEEKQELFKTIFSNCEVNGKNVSVKPYLPFQLMIERPSFTAGSPKREAARTLSLICKKINKFLKNLDMSNTSDPLVKRLTPKPKKLQKRNISGLKHVGRYYPPIW